MSRVKTYSKVKERPILFSTPMVQAILEGRKTMTRRAMRPQPELHGRMWLWKGAGWSDNIKVIEPVIGHSMYYACPFGKIGDILWVRETWCILCYVDPEGYTHFDQEIVYYRADGDLGITLRDGDGFEEEDQRIKWKPSIFIPKEHSRIFLEITDIRVERLQGITDTDALLEGIKSRPHSEDPKLILYQDYSFENRFAHGKGWGPKQSFQSLWQSINGQESWQQNPWVWVIEYKVLSTTGKPEQLIKQHEQD